MISNFNEILSLIKNNKFKEAEKNVKRLKIVLPKMLSSFTHMDLFFLI